MGTNVKKFFDTFERTVWTVAEGAGALGILAGYQALPLVDVPKGYIPIVIILLGGLLAAVKGSIAAQWNDTASTLPQDLEPVRSQVVVVPTPLPPVEEPAPDDPQPEPATEVEPEPVEADEPSKSEPEPETDDAVAEPMVAAVPEQHSGVNIVIDTAGDPAPEADPEPAEDDTPDPEWSGK